MKCLVLFCLIFLAKVSARPTQDISQDMPDVSLDTIHDAVICSRQLKSGAKKLENTKSDGILPEDNDTFSSYYGCIWKRKKIIDDNGEVDRSNLKKYLEDLFTMGQEITHGQSLLVEDVMDHCENIQGSSHGLTAIKIQNCVMKRLQTLIDDRE